MQISQSLKLDLQGATLEELYKMLDDYKRISYNLRIQSTLSESFSQHRLRTTRRDTAKILTAIRARSLMQDNSSSAKTKLPKISRRGN